MRKMAKAFLCTSLFMMIAPFTALGADILVSAQSAVVIDSQTGTVVYEKNPDQALAMASTTKIMTAVCAIEKGRLNDIITITKDMMAEGSSIYLKEGESLTLEDLLYGMMLNSGNDAANAIAVHISGSLENFAKLMNDTASKIGLSKTSFENPSGLDGENHYTTALELAKLSQYAMRNETFRKIVSTKTKNISGPDKVRTFTNHNRLLRMYEGVNGIKTGYTKTSGRCLVSSACRGDSEFIIVTLNAPNDWNDHMKLFDYAFENFYTCTLVKEGPTSKVIPVVGGQSSFCCTCFENDFKITLKKEDPLPEVIYYLPKFAYAPVKTDQLAGYAGIMQNDKIIGEVSIKYISSVSTQLSSKAKESVWQKIISFLLERFGIRG